MQITVFGATGRVGRLVVEQLLHDGHTITAFVHQVSGLEPSERLKIIKSDVHNAAFVEAAVRGSDAVVSALGSWHTPTKDILSAAMRFIIPAMQKEGIKRIVAVTGAATFAPGEKVTFIDKLTRRALMVVAKDIVRDAETHLSLLAASDLDWTVLRSPIMKDRSDRSYALSNERAGLQEVISRQAVAQAMVDQLTDRKHVKRTPFIHATAVT